MHEKTKEMKKQFNEGRIDCNLELQLLSEIHSVLNEILEELKKGVKQ